MKKIIKRFLNFLQKIRNRKKCNIDIRAFVRGQCEFEGKNRICAETIFISSKLGFGSYIGSRGRFTNVKISKFCSIGENVSIVSATHPTDFISTHPSFYSNENGGFSYVKKTKGKESLLTENGYTCEIGNDVWIGSNVLIRGGIKIGDGAIIGMGAVVTKDVPPFAIVGGVPAKIIKYRFNEKTISKILESAWWDRDEQWITSKSELFTDTEAFLKEVSDENM